MSVSVLIVEGNAFVRVGLENILSDAEGIDVCGVYDAAADALAACCELHPDVVLLDRPLAAEVSLPDLREQCAGEGGVLVFLDRLQEEEIFGMLSDGVAGFIAKRDDPETLCQAIRAVADGDDVWLSPRVSKMLLPPRREASRRAQLTPREQGILRALAAGRANAEIACDHHLSVGTVRNVVSAIYGKLGVKTRVAAVAWAWRNGIADGSRELERRDGEAGGSDADARSRDGDELI